MWFDKISNNLKNLIVENRLFISLNLFINIISLNIIEYSYKINFISHQTRYNIVLIVIIFPCFFVAVKVSKPPIISRTFRDIKSKIAGVSFFLLFFFIDAVLYLYLYMFNDFSFSFFQITIISVAIILGAISFYFMAVPLNRNSGFNNMER